MSDPIEGPVVDRLLYSHAKQALDILRPIIVKDHDFLYGIKGGANIHLRPDGERQIGSIVPSAVHRQQRDTLSVIIEPQHILNYTEKYSYKTRGDVLKVIVGAGVAKALFGWNLSHFFSSIELDSDRSRVVSNYNESVSCSDGIAEYCEDDTDLSTLSMSVARMPDSEIARVNVLRFSMGVALRHLINPQIQTEVVKEASQLLLDEVETNNQQLIAEMSWNSVEAAMRNFDTNMPHITLALATPMKPAEEAAYVDFDKLYSE